MCQKNSGIMGLIAVDLFKNMNGGKTQTLIIYMMQCVHILQYLRIYLEDDVLLFNKSLKRA